MGIIEKIENKFQDFKDRLEKNRKGKLETARKNLQIQALKKITPDRIKETQEFIRKHPYDLLQPSDPRFNDVYGERNRKAKDDITRARNDAILEHEERKKFEIRKLNEPSYKKYW